MRIEKKICLKKREIKKREKKRKPTPSATGDHRETFFKTRIMRKEEKEKTSTLYKKIRTAMAERLPLVVVVVVGLVEHRMMHWKMEENHVSIELINV